VDIAELKARLDQAGINKRAYSFDGDLPDERYVLSQEPNEIWEVYYSERGNKNELRLFFSESDACQFFLDLLVKDPTTRRKIG